jgi:hypothetical protein
MALVAHTVRFTDDQWAWIVAECERLGIAKSAFIRDAVLLYLGRRQAEERIKRLEQAHAALAKRVDGLVLLVRRLMERFGVG